MTRSHKKIWFSASLVLSLVLAWCLLPLTAKAFGISPPHVINDRLFSGSHYEQKISLSRIDTDEELNCEVEFDTFGFENWFTITPNKIFPFPEGEKVTKMFVKVDVPKDAEPGRYRGSIRVRVVPKEKEKGKITVVLGARIDVDLTVTSEKFSEFEVRRVQIPDLEEGWTIKVDMKIENKGNVEIATDKITLDIYDSSNKNLLESTETTKLPKIEPFETKEISAFLKAKLTIGQFWGEVKVYKGEEVVWHEKAIFTVQPKGSLPPRVGAGFASLSIWLWIVIGLIIVAGIGYVVWRFKFKKRKFKFKNLRFKFKKWRFKFKKKK